MPSLLITRAEFLLQEKMTKLTYFWLWKRRIAALPVCIEIRSHPSKADCYTGVAVLSFESRHPRIPLLYTDGWCDLDTTAEWRAAESASQIKHVLHLDEKLPDHDSATFKDRISDFFGGVFFAGFAAVLVWTAFSKDGFGDFLPRMLAAFMGALLGIVAVYYFWLVLKPRRAKSKRLAKRGPSEPKLRQ